MAAITISRQYGSGGRKVAIRVSELLGWPLFDKRLIMQVAGEVALSPDDITDFTEYDYEAKGFWKRLFSPENVNASTSFLGSTYESTEIGTLTTKQMDQEGAVRLVNKAITMSYERGNVVIVGRGGQALLQNKRDVMHVRVQAPMDMRKARLESYEDIKQEDTESAALDRDKSGQAYMKRFFDVDLEDPELYHLIINSGKIDIEKVADVIVASAKQLLNFGD